MYRNETAKMEEIVNETISVEEIKKFERAYNSELARGKVNSRTQFEYAWCLVRSPYTNDIKKGTVLMEQLLQGGNPQIQRDCLFYLGVGHFRLKDYTKALQFVKGLLQIEPNNHQAKELEVVIKKKMNKDGLVGMAVIGGAAVVIGGLVAAGMAISKGK
ncbi:Mitochondrial fission 1 protein [Holothuria leucospilota]|uniref:Mitochondrial fission 1 protein n=1 Tax=Holothuria leucospilota TaxID=206669 RepID=A0A9Q1BQH4_HOLLE|nr:Mitochondrial fission 1 protein [Holothuria leucospilota]